MRSLRRIPVGWPAALLLACLAFQCGAFILLHSDTVDEMAYIGSGAYYVRTGHFDNDIWEHPPLMKYLIGAALLPVSGSFPSFDRAASLGTYRFGREFLYRHPAAKPESILALARLPSLLLSLVLGAFVFAWASRWYGARGGLLALAAYCFEPNLITHSSLATMDLGLTCFLFLSTYFLVSWLETRRSLPLVASGIFAGCAIATKIPGLIFFLWAPCLLALEARRGRSYGWRALLSLAAAAAVVLLLVYRVRYLPAIAELFRYRLQQTFFPASGEADPVFLHGAIRVGGWRSYFIVAFLVKTTIPFLLLCGWTLLAGRDPRRKLSLLLPVVSYFLFCSLSSKQGGLRYMLPVFPFLCVAIGALAETKDRARLAAIAALTVWSALECAFVFPHYLPYYNESIGGPANGYLWFWDSNTDWGQDFRKIGDYLRKQGSPEVIFASPFAADREYHLGPRQDLAGSSEFGFVDYGHINSANPSRELLVVSAALLDGLTLVDPKTFSWLLRDRKPVDVIGHTTFVYDVTSDAPSHYYMGRIYKNTKRYALAAREFRRSAALAPANPLPRQALRETLSAIKHDGS